MPTLMPDVIGARGRYSYEDAGSKTNIRYPRETSSTSCTRESAASVALSKFCEFEINVEISARDCSLR